jgi:hypothetical protein
MCWRSMCDQFLGAGSYTKVRNPIPLGYASFYTMYYEDIGEFQILYSQDICW